MTFQLGATTVTIDAMLFPVERRATRHQTFSTAGDGTRRVYDRGFNDENIKLVIKDDHDNLTNIRTFIEDTVKMRLTPFTLTPDSGVDLGNGDGTGITARYWDSNFIETMVSWHQYRYILQIRKEPELAWDYEDDIDEIFSNTYDEAALIPTFGG